jgi:hypothetical protein
MMHTTQKGLLRQVNSCATRQAYKQNKKGEELDLLWADSCKRIDDDIQCYWVWCPQINPDCQKTICYHHNSCHYTCSWQSRSQNWTKWYFFSSQRSQRENWIHKNECHNHIPHSSPMLLELHIANVMKDWRQSLFSFLWTVAELCI